MLPFFIFPVLFFAAGGGGCINKYNVGEGVRTKKRRFGYCRNKKPKNITGMKNKKCICMDEINI